MIRIQILQTDPNHTSGKNKLTPPVDSYTTILLVLTSALLKLLGLRDIFSGQCGGDFWPCEGPGFSGVQVDDLI